MRPALVDSLVFVHVVSIHVLARGATGTPSSTRARCSGFNPRARTGRDHGVSRELWVPRVVSIHAPAQGATGVRAHGGGRCDVSIHAPAWGATSATMPRIASTQFQSTRPHGARHYCPTCGARVVGVSIHTPARGATAVEGAVDYARQVSIHAPARGATVGRARRVPNRYVSIHAPARGATARALDARAVSQVVSIHASARGATVGAVEGRGLRVVSIHAPARGATGAVQVAGREARFQSTRPHGARRAGRLLGQGPVGFNPRARTGRDLGEHAAALALEVSIHAPARGATFWQHAPALALEVSIHAPARGATLSGYGITDAYTFQSTRPHGARLLRTYASVRSASFQSTRPHGARLGVPPVSSPSPAFQSTRPHGARHLQAHRQLRRVAVSIHAPARGATGADQAHGRAGSVSIHAPARGATIAAASDIFGTKFQSTRPHGARPWTKTDRGSPRGFNPRARTGRDDLACVHGVIAKVSIHAPARGATPALVYRGRPHAVSIHAPARGATLAAVQRHHLADVSIHAPARGAT